MTLIEAEWFRKIFYREFLRQGWSKKGSKNGSQNILGMNARFNTVQRGEVSTVLKGSSAKERGKLLRWFIEVSPGIDFSGELLSDSCRFRSLSNVGTCRIGAV